MKTVTLKCGNTQIFAPDAFAYPLVYSTVGKLTKIGENKGIPKIKENSLQIVDLQAVEDGRNSEIRTHDLLTPSQTR